MWRKQDVFCVYVFVCLCVSQPTITCTCLWIIPRTETAAFMTFHFPRWGRRNFRLPTLQPTQFHSKPSHSGAIDSTGACMHTHVHTHTHARTHTSYHAAMGGLLLSLANPLSLKWQRLGPFGIVDETQMSSKPLGICENMQWHILHIIHNFLSNSFPLQCPLVTFS